MASFKKLAGETAIYGIPTIVGRLLNYLLVPLYTYKFNPEEYGVVTEMYAYSSFLLIVLTYGMETTLFRFSQMDYDKNKVYTTSLIAIVTTSVLFVVFSFLFTPQLASLIRYPENQEYVKWFALILGFDALCSVPFAKLRQENKAKKFAFIKSLNILLNILLNLFFIVLCPYLLKNNIAVDCVNMVYAKEVGVGYIFLSNVYASAFTFLLLLPTIIKERYDYDYGILKKMLVYTYPLLFAGLAGIINETLDRILIKYLIPDHHVAMTQVGIYGACYKISILMTIFIQTFKFAAEPFFFSHSKEKNADEIYANVMRYFVIACLFIFLGTMMYIDIIKFFIGKDFRIGLHVVPILLLANMFLGIYYNLSIWYKLSGQTYYGAYISLIGAAITLIINFLLIPRIGYTGAAWATFACYTSMMAVSYFVGQRKHNINYPVKKLSVYFLVAMFFYFISTLIPTETITIPVKLIINTLFLLVYTFYIFKKENLLSKISLKIN
ncbi:MAG: polysaccharide biosynthesis C-terminal domain-containing protein [Bacteroidetes bacterium]|nr:polysaccharide biosynthesis C-terminal domain-containing protein [Bacteroidota bacterium]